MPSPTENKLEEGSTRFGRITHALDLQSVGRRDLEQQVVKSLNICGLEDRMSRVETDRTNMLYIHEGGGREGRRDERDGHTRKLFFAKGSD